MPIYTYQVLHADGSDGEIFEYAHGMSEPPLTCHPKTGEPVQRIYQAPHIAGSWHDRQHKQAMSDKNLDRLGFTKYVKNGKGHYEKHVGHGPDTLNP